MKKVVVMGGGTGSFMVLSGLRDKGFDLSAIVTMSDNGGSSGLLRDELGVLPPGDVRQCLVALSRAQKPLRQLFTHRFSRGSLKGHTVGNLFLAGLENMTGNFSQAVKTAGHVLQIQGRVIPVTLKKVQLCAQLVNGRTLLGESTITQSRFLQKPGLKKLYLKPQAQANPEAVEAILQANLFVMAPGNLYSSLIPNLLVKGIAQAIAKSKAKKVYVSNLMTKKGQTDGFFVQAFVKVLEQWAQVKLFDTVIYNTKMPSPKLLERYKQEGSPVIFDTSKKANNNIQYIGTPLLSSHIIAPPKNDPLAWQRSLIRHDSKKIASLLEQIINEV